ncbi:MAG TPA: NAD-dependent epimerase/dehydratase family protein, partial [Puia sp.]|nr:NAD-dependent epimerase/dehydratase family protein [Puia sp.]
LMSTVALLRASVNAGVRRFIFCSSMSRYGNQTTPFDEYMNPKPADPYAYAKVAAEDIVRHMCDLYDMEYVIVVPHNIYGPNQRYYDPFRNVVGIMINRALLGKSLIVYGDGRQVRSFSYISDVTEPFLTMATADATYVSGQVFNVGPDGEDNLTINDLAELVRFATGKDCDIEHYPDRPREVKYATCSCAKARAVLGYEPKVSFINGLLKYVKWVQEQGPREFEYHLPLEIVSDMTPKTWTEKLM